MRYGGHVCFNVASPVWSIFFETGYVYLNDLSGKSASFPEDVTFGYISVIELRWDF